MLTISLRDLQFRRRRFVVGVLGAALVLGITLLLTGIPASWVNEARRTVDSFHGEDWVVPEGVTGPFLSSASFPATIATEVAVDSGVETAAIAILHGIARP